MQHKSFLPLGVGKNKEIAELVLKLALLLGPTLWGHLTYSLKFHILLLIYDKYPKIIHPVHSLLKYHSVFIPCYNLHLNCSHKVSSK